MTKEQLAKILNKMHAIHMTLYILLALLGGILGILMAK